MSKAIRIDGERTRTMRSSCLAPDHNILRAAQGKDSDDTIAVVRRGVESRAAPYDRR